MQSSSKLTVGLAILAMLMVVDSALAYYNPATGRFLSRDPIGEPGAMLVQHASVQQAFIPRDRARVGEQVYGYVANDPTSHIDPLGLMSVAYGDVAGLIGGCSYALPANSSDWRLQQRGLITPEVMLCLFWKESSFDTEKKSNQGYYGLGQMGKEACDDVDKAYGLVPGTCWQRQQSNDPCWQMANSIAYLHHILVNKNDFGHDGTLRGGLHKYGPTDAGFNEYANPILECAECLKKHERYHREDKGGPRGPEFCTKENAQACFDEMNEKVKKERAKRGL